MSMIEIPDGERSPIHFESTSVIAVRSAGEDKTWIFLRGEEGGWKVECQVARVLSLIPKRYT
jgi:hypothetical protein